MFNQVFYLSMKKKNAAKIGEKRRKKALHIRISRFKPNTGTLSKPKTAIPKRVFGYPNTIRLTFNSLLVMIGDGVLGKARDMGGVVAEEARVEFGITFGDGV